MLLLAKREARAGGSGSFLCAENEKEEKAASDVPLAELQKLRTKGVVLHVFNDK